MKSGGAYDTIVLSPFVDNGDKDERAKIRAGYKAAMDHPGLDIAIKRQNTMRFRDHCDEKDAKLMASLFAAKSPRSS